MSIAVRIGRAFSKRDVVLFSGYHGWCDWYLAANLADDCALDGQLMPGLSPVGVPRGLKGSAAPFDVSDSESLRAAILERDGDVGVVVLEPARGAAISEGALGEIRRVCDEFGIVLVYDEITSGFRCCEGGMHRLHDIRPDIAVFAKGMANGYPMAAILGTSIIMSAAQDTFISSTNWTDRTGPTAALATIEKYIRTETDVHIQKIGELVQEMWKQEAGELGVDITVSGIPSLPAFTFNDDLSTHLDSIFVELMLGQGILGFRQFKPSLAHSLQDLDQYSEAFRRVLKQISRLSEQQIKDAKPSHRGFYRLTK